jgi:predicted permease
VEGRTPAIGENFLNCDERVAGGRYVQALRIPLLEGRWFDERDIIGNPRVILVDEFMARELWPGESAIGKRVRTGGLRSTSPWLTVIGVVGRVKQDSLDVEPRIAMYFPHTQSPSRAMIVTVRVNGDPAAIAAAVKREIHALDSDLPVYYVRTMNERIGEYLAPRRFSVVLLAVFAGLAVALAAIGVYGVMAYLVNQSTREIGIRIALGATERGILGLVVRRGMTVAGLGVFAGLVAALVLTRFLRGLLYGVDATDPLTFVALPLVLAAIAFTACYIPARRAARLDPMDCLRAE